MIQRSSFCDPEALAWVAIDLHFDPFEGEGAQPTPLSDFLKPGSPRYGEPHRSHASTNVANLPIKTDAVTTPWLHMRHTIFGEVVTAWMS